MKENSWPIAIGAFLILFSFITIFPNEIVGEYGYFRTDLFGNLIYFLSGITLILFALKFEYKVSKLMRGLGKGFLALAVLGALTSGFNDFGMTLGILASSGSLHILNLLLGLALLVVGTREMRMSLDLHEETAGYHVDMHS